MFLLDCSMLQLPPRVGLERWGLLRRCSSSRLLPQDHCTDSDACWELHSVWMESLTQRPTLKRQTLKAFVGSSGSLNQKKRVASLSPSSRLTCRKAFSISVRKSYLWQRKRRRMPVGSLAMGVPARTQSFRLGSYTTRIGVVADSLNTAWWGR